MSSTLLVILCYAVFDTTKCFIFLGTIATVTTRMNCGLLHVLHIIISSLCVEAVGTMV